MTYGLSDETMQRLEQHAGKLSEAEDVVATEVEGSILQPLAHVRFYLDHRVNDIPKEVGNYIAAAGLSIVQFEERYGLPEDTPREAEADETFLVGYVTMDSVYEEFREDMRDYSLDIEPPEG